ncbi:AMP-dependent synthetase/ligase [Quadrisphaera sp. GCM10027208]|uniref:AMP-dependent synthetase/ligase n=1 Tax=Quadrisphaera sp. GCM10027208 TaxID=3273423 RepID=UPI00361052B7
MREVHVPPLVEVDPSSNLTDLVVDNAVSDPHKVVFRRPVADRWQDVTAREFLAEVTGLAKGLIAAGVQPGDRVGLMARTRYEWTLIDFANWFAGAVTVPIYETSSAEQVQWILGDSGAVACFVETSSHAATVASARDKLPALRDVWQIDSGAVAEVTAAGTEVDDATVEERRRIAGLHDLATIIYTSGTTGRPKGCELTHGNFVVLSKNAVARLHEVVDYRVDDTEASALMFLPLAHVLARFIQVLNVAAAVTMGHTPDVKNLMPDLASFRPTYVLAVPRVFEKVYNSAEQKAEADGRGNIFRRAAAVAIDYSRALDSGGPGLGLRIQHAVFDRLVYGKIRQALGGRAKYAISGGAPLGERLGHFFRGIGLVVLEGYGLTETTAPTSVNTPELIKIGTVGPQLPGNSVKIADDGEILIKGPHVFRGYWNNEAATKEAFDEDGWFKTGDLGELDEDGFLRITGRKKEILVTAGGKNVAPAALEDRIRAHPLVDQCLVIGDQKPYIAALITLDPEMLPTWLSNHGKPEMTPAEAAQDPDVRAAIQSAIDEANASVSRAESIRKFEILHSELTEGSGHLTPSLKLKRSEVLKDFAHKVDEMYKA